MVDVPDLATTEAAIIEKTNAFRREKGMAPVARNEALERAARRFAQYLAASGKFAHEADGRQPADRTRQDGYTHCAVAENLALNLDSRGFTTQKLAGAAVEGWKQSPGHRKNMLLPNVTETGVGIAKAPAGDPKYISVQLFGQPLDLAYQFKLANNADEAVDYSFLGRFHVLEPRFTATHTACDPGNIRFTKSGGWLFGGAALDVTLEVTRAATFVIHKRPDGSWNVTKEQ